jgi:plasmid stabilization system protein ParE
MKVVIRAAAAADLDGIFNWISKDSPKSAAEMVRRIRARVNRLATTGLPHVGRPGRVRGTRELVESSYIIVYSVNEAADEVVVLAIIHGSRNREG